MRCLVDNQLPIALSRFLKAEKIDAIHVIDVGLETTSDKEIWHYAQINDYIVISKDEDFLHLALQDGKGYLIWVRLGNCRKAELLNAFAKALPILKASFAQGEKIIELT